MRGEYTVGLDILALKFKAAGFALDRNAIDWLRLLNGENTTFYERFQPRQPADLGRRLDRALRYLGTDAGYAGLRG